MSGKYSKMKANGGINAESKFHANRFLRVHLHILKALHEEARITPPISGDSRVEEQYWGLMDDFLVERNTIRRTTKRAQRMREICDEAMEFQKTVPPIPVAKNQAFSHQFSPQFQRHGSRNHDLKGPRSNFKFGSSAMMLITQPSPHYFSNRTPRGWNGRGDQSTGQRNPMIQCEMTEEEGGNVFGIVSGLLKRKHKLASRHLDRRTSKFQALVKESQSRIETLNSELIVEKERTISAMGSANEDIENLLLAKEECEDRQVMIETKIRLWKLLLHDLKGTISVQTPP